MSRETEKAAGYNGWTNYETWAVALWINNEQGMQDHARALAQDAIEAAPRLANVKASIWSLEQGRRFGMADMLKVWVGDDLLPDLGATLASDLLGAALSEVNWHELADSFLADYAEEVSHER
jgi:hypothetical protein